MARQLPRGTGARTRRGSGLRGASYRIGTAQDILGSWVGSFACIDCHYLLRPADIVAILPEDYDMPASSVEGEADVTIGQSAVTHATCLLLQLETALGLSVVEAKATSAAIREIVG